MVGATARARGPGAAGSVRVKAMPSPLLADAFGHHVWATIRVLDACAVLDEAKLATTVPGTYGSIIDTLRHLVDGDVFYLDVLTGSAEPFDNPSVGQEAVDGGDSGA
jgi:uncharacterized damage-inducible protein DinB